MHNKKLSKYFDYKVDDNGKEYLEVYLRGMSLLRLSATNKGTAFTEKERIDLGLEGLLPPHIVDLEHQIERLYRSYQCQSSDIEKYQFLRAVQERSEVTYFALLENHLEEMMPIIYTPTVGKAVQNYSALYRTPRGLTLSPLILDRIDQAVDNYPWNDVRMIVVTDSSAILGIGDQGHGGLAICIGKLALYTSGGGVSPYHTMPVNLDVGTNRKELLDDPNYLGVHLPRISGDDYFNLLDRFVETVQARWPLAVIQWEDFAKDVAFSVLERYRNKIPCFNDDIQGTGAVVLAGILAACHLKGEKLSEQRVIVVGAGAGGVGVAKAIQDGMVREGLSREQARRQMFVLDGRGLVVETINKDSYKLQVAQFEDSYQDWPIDGDLPGLMDVVSNAKPTILLGLSGIVSLFTQPIIEAMAKHNERPIIFPLSNPTSNCEALPEDIIKWTQGSAIVASGSPFSDVEYEGKSYVIGQGNNAFIFPGLGFATILGNCKNITDEMVLESAYTLAEYTIEHYVGEGLIYPPIADLQNVSIKVASNVLSNAIEDGVSSRTDLTGKDVQAYVKSRFWRPEFLPFVAGKELTEF
ncbi:MAG: NAD-dependent malic enzyme [Gammaproteobacteria bacterium]|nr:NAD-dependent malic enzyme [Gammaproteobacteria bacterium]